MGQGRTGAFEGRRARIAALAVVVASSAVTYAEIAAPHSEPARALGLFFSMLSLLEGLARLAAARRGTRGHVLAACLPELVAAATLAAPAGSPLLLLRYARALRLVSLARPTVARLRGSARALVRVGLAASLVLVVGSSALLALERDVNPALASPGHALWSVLYSMVAGEPIPAPPETWGGRLVSALVIATGLATFATAAGTAGAIVTEAIRTGGPMVAWDELEGHIVVCGWNRKAELIVREVLSAHATEPPVVVITDAEGEPAFVDEGLRRSVQFLNADFTEVATLERAGVSRAKKCILLSDTSRGRSERDADARTILAALTIERLNRDVYTCAEVHTRDHLPHLRMGNVNDVVVSGEHSAFLLAQAALTTGVMGVFEELLTLEYGSKFVTVPVPSRWVGKPFREVLARLKDEHDALLVGVRRGAGRVELNPKGHTFVAEDTLVIIASGDLAL